MLEHNCTYHSLPYAQTDNYDPIKRNSRRWISSRRRVFGEKSEGEGGGRERGNSTFHSGIESRGRRIERVGSLPGRARVLITNHRELLEILLERRRLRLVHEVTVLVDALRRQVRWTWMTRRAGRRRWIVAVAQRAPLPADRFERKGLFLALFFVDKVSLLFRPAYLDR